MAGAAASASSADDREIILEFLVEDTGMGIPAQDQKRIFEPFTQADASTSRIYGGTGLGLTISSRLVDMMNGHLWVDSQVGQGSVFQFTATFRSDMKPERDAPALISSTTSS